MFISRLSLFIINILFKIVLGTSFPTLFMDIFPFLEAYNRKTKRIIIIQIHLAHEYSFMHLYRATAIRRFTAS